MSQCKVFHVWAQVLQSTQINKITMYRCDRRFPSGLQIQLSCSFSRCTWMETQWLQNPQSYAFYGALRFFGLLRPALCAGPCLVWLQLTLWTHVCGYTWGPNPICLSKQQQWYFGSGTQQHKDSKYFDCHELSKSFFTAIIAHVVQWHENI